MSIELFRIDERLIHGQVVVAWGSKLHPERIIVIDDDIAGSQWEQELYGIGLPPELPAEFVPVERAIQQFSEWRDGPERVILLARSVETVTRLNRDGLLQGIDINVGGIHHGPERREALPYVYLSDDESAALRDIAASGAAVSARDLPGARHVPLDQLLSGGGFR
jgi:mannose/fructose/N-acetylgalactosamine-specific phosphotransferase system component IIB